MARHTVEGLAALSSAELIRLVLELQRRVEELEASPGLRQAEEPAPPTPALNGAPPKSAPGPLLMGFLEGERLTQEQDTLEYAKPNLERGISRIPANVEAATKLRKELAQVVEGIVLERQNSSPQGSEIGKAWSRLTHSNFFLPDFGAEEPGLAEFVESKLTAPEYQERLEETLALNWVIGRDLGEEHRLRVLRTAADGNCLLHGTLLAMWGLHDTTQVGTSGLSSLRAAMSRIFQEPKFAEPLRKRWTEQIARDSAWQPASQEDKREPRRVEVSEEQLNREWADMVDIAGRPNAFLDSVHVLALAHALRRPIVVLASTTHTDPFGEPLTPVFFRGIYLPMERAPEQCCRQPLLLCFQDAHFMPVVPSATQQSLGVVRVPLADGHGEELPLRFALESELERRWELVEKYMDVERSVTLPLAKVECNIAMLRRNTSHSLVKEMADHTVERYAKRFREEKEKERAERENADTKRKAPEDSQEDAPLVPPKRQKSMGKDAGGAAPNSQESGRAPGLGQELNEPKEGEELDAPVEDKFEVRLPRGSRPGDRTFYNLPKGCTDKDRVDFDVPAGCYENDLVLLTARFKIKGHCIRSLREVTNLSREKAVQLLTVTHGNVERAIQQYFDEGLPDN